MKLYGQDYTNLVNDSSIVIKAMSGQGSRDGTTSYASITIGIFKNGILYDYRSMETAVIPAINVHNNIQENEFENFIKEKIKNILDDEVHVADIKEGAKIRNVDVKNGYTVYFKEEIMPDVREDVVIINREKPVNITNVDKETNIKLETTTAVVPENTTLEIEWITEGEKYNTLMATLGNKVNKFTLYDITLKSNGVKIQPSGKVKISIPVPEEFDKEKLVIYRINEDGTKVRYDINVETIEGKDYATFETDHFSLYTLVSEKTDNNNSNELNENPTVDKELDTTPKTGSIDVSGYAIVIVFEIVILGMIILKKYLK